jgi:hypothetical protein
MARSFSYSLEGKLPFSFLSQPLTFPHHKRGRGILIRIAPKCKVNKKFPLKTEKINLVKNLEKC